MLYSMFKIKLLMIFLLAFISVYCSAQKPFIMRSPEDAVVLAGEDVVLYCSVENLPLDSLVQWTKGSFGLGYDKVLSGFPRYSIIGDESIGEYNLLIRNISLEDEDQYECQVTSHGIRTKPVTLNVQALPVGPFVQDAKNNFVNVQENHENQITCHSINGKPAATLQWFKDGVEQRGNVAYAIAGDLNEFQNTSASLRIWPRRENDGDTYTCILTTVLTNNNKKTTVSKNTTVVIRVQRPPKANVIIEPSSNVMAGSPISVLCDAKMSKPKASYYAWFLNGKEIPDKSGSRIHFDEASKDMGGMRIGCQAINQVGKSLVSSASLNVLYAPVLTTPPKKAVVEIGKTAAFTCEWTSNPSPTITWFKGTELLGHGETLTIQQVKQTDEGEITCEAKASHIGRRVAKADLVVLGPPVIQPKEIQFAEVNSDAGIIECRVLSNPGITSLTWNWNSHNTNFYLSDNSQISKDGNVVQNDIHKVKYRGYYVPGQSVAQLFIYDVNLDDFTEYNCSVANEYGYEDATVLLKQYQTGFQISIGIICAILGGILFVAIVILCYCKFVGCGCAKAQIKKDKKKEEIFSSPAHRPPTASESLLLHSRNDPEDMSTQPSSSTTPDELMLMMRPYSMKSPGSHDDGYCTEADFHPGTRGNSSLSTSSVANSLTIEQMSPLLAQVDCSHVRPSYSFGRNSDLHRLSTQNLPMMSSAAYYPAYIKVKNTGSDAGSSVSMQTSSSNSPFYPTQGYPIASKIDNIHPQNQVHIRNTSLGLQGDFPLPPPSPQLNLETARMATNV